MGAKLGVPFDENVKTRLWKVELHRAFDFFPEANLKRDGLAAVGERDIPFVAQASRSPCFSTKKRLSPPKEQKARKKERFRKKLAFTSLVSVLLSRLELISKPFGDYFRIGPRARLLSRGYDPVKAVWLAE